jgi:hypothetical protein
VSREPDWSDRGTRIPSWHARSGKAAIPPLVRGMDETETRADVLMRRDTVASVLIVHPLGRRQGGLRTLWLLLRGQRLSVGAIQDCMFTPVSSQTQAFVPAHTAYPHLRPGQNGPGGHPWEVVRFDSTSLGAAARWSPDPVAAVEGAEVVRCSLRSHRKPKPLCLHTPLTLIYDLDRMDQGVAVHRLSLVESNAVAAPSICGGLEPRATNLSGRN